MKDGIDLPFVFIPGHGDVPMSFAVMKAGAIEFLNKPFRHQVLHHEGPRQSDAQNAGTVPA